MAQWGLADAQARLSALAEELRAERETSAAAQLRAERAERKLVPRERRVRSVGACPDLRPCTGNQGRLRCPVEPSVLRLHCEPHLYVRQVP